MPFPAMHLRPGSESWYAMILQAIKLALRAHGTRPMHGSGTGSCGAGESVERGSDEIGHIREANFKESNDHTSPGIAANDQPQTMADSTDGLPLDTRSVAWARR